MARTNLTRNVLLASLLVAGCGLHLQGAAPSSGGGAQPRPPTVDLGSVATPPPDLMSTADLGATSCPSTDCATTCAPCCRESCTSPDGCSQSCPGGTSGCNCDFTCSSSSSGNVTCGDASTCVALADDAEETKLDCAPNATCWLTCGSHLNGTCTLSCSPGASCRVDCGTSGSDCTLENCPGGAITCPNNVQVCGRACP